MSSLAEMTSLISTATVLIMVAVLQASADDSAYTTADIRSFAQTRDQDTVGAVGKLLRYSFPMESAQPTISTSTAQLPTIQEMNKPHATTWNINSFYVDMFLALLRDVDNSNHVIFRPNQGKRFRGWKTHYRIFRSDLGKRSIPRVTRPLPYSGQLSLKLS